MVKNTSKPKIYLPIDFEFEETKKKRLSRGYDGCSEFQGIGPDSQKV